MRAASGLSVIVWEKIMSKAVRKWIQKDREVAKALHEAIVRDYPVSAPIHWARGRHRQTGVVIDHDRGGTRLKVKSGATFKEYWIRIYDVHDAEGCVGAW